MEGREGGNVNNTDQTKDVHIVKTWKILQVFTYRIMTRKSHFVSPKHTITR